MGDFYLQFDGSTGYVTVPSNAALNVGEGDFSISAWFKLDDPTEINQHWICIKHAHPVAYGVYIQNDANGSTLNFYTFYAAAGTASCPITLTDKWTHIVCTRHETESTIYINGESQTATGSLKEDDLDNAGAFRIGIDYNPSYYIDGAIDDLRLYKKVLSASEVSAIYNSGAGTQYFGEEAEGGSALAFNFSEGTGTETYSSGTAVLTGTLTNDVEWLPGGTPFWRRDLTILIPNHGYSDGDTVFVSWLNKLLYVTNSTADTIKLSYEEGGLPIQFTEEVVEGSVREVDTSEATTTISGLEHLEGRSVYVMSNGQIVGFYPVVDGSITVDTDVYTYQVGLPYTMKIRTMRLELPNVQGLQGRIKRINETTIRYLRSKGGQTGQEYSGKLYLNDINAEYSKQSKDARSVTGGGFSTDAYTVIQSDKPYPFTVLAVVIEFSVDED